MDDNSSPIWNVVEARGNARPNELDYSTNWRRADRIDYYVGHEEAWVIVRRDALKDFASLANLTKQELEDDENLVVCHDLAVHIASTGGADVVIIPEDDVNEAVRALYLSHGGAYFVEWSNAAWEK